MFRRLQRRLIYRPHRVSHVCPVAAGLGGDDVDPVSYVTSDALTLQGWLVSAAKRRRFPGTVVFFPGNGHNRGRRGGTCRALSSMGLDTYLFDYRGYAENPGNPTEELIAGDARSIWRFLTVERGIPSNEILVYGESLGGGVATRLTAELCVESGGDSTQVPAGLVLCATFSSLLEAAVHNYWWLPVRSVLVERYASMGLIPDVTCPIQIMHGGRDRVVPISLARRLFESAPGSSRSGIEKQFVALPGAGHNDFLKVEEEGYRRGFERFLESLERIAF